MKPENAKPRLLDQMRNIIRLHQYSIATERVYLHWAKRFILFHGKRHPNSMGKREVEGFLTYLAVNRQVASSTQNVALAAILFLYSKVLGTELPWMDDVVRAKTRRRIPVVLNALEVDLLLKNCRSSQLLPVIHEQDLVNGFGSAGLPVSQIRKLGKSTMTYEQP